MLYFFYFQTKNHYFTIKNKKMSKLGRPRKENKKVVMNITIDSDINEKLEKYLIDNKLSKSEYIEILIKKDKNKWI